jgi:hypothetical protein
MRLTVRDLKTIEAIWQYRVMSQAQIHKLLYTDLDSSVVKRRLYRLYHNGFVARQFLPVRGGLLHSPILYTLDKRGAELLQKHGFTVSWKHDNNRVGSTFLDHALAISDVRIAFAQACAAQKVSLLTWHGESQMKHQYDRVKISSSPAGEPIRDVAVIPDSAFTLQLPRGASHKTAHFFLELDRGTMSLKRFKRKVEAYLAYLDTGAYTKRYSTKSLRILTVTENMTRLAHLKRVTEQAGGRSRFWFTTRAEIQRQNALSQPLWRVAGRTEASAILTTPE